MVFNWVQSRLRLRPAPDCTQQATLEASLGTCLYFVLRCARLGRSPECLQQPTLVSHGQGLWPAVFNTTQTRVSSGQAFGGPVLSQLPPLFFCPHAFLFTLSSAIKSSLRNQFTARKTSSLQSVGVLGPLDRPCLASAITRSFIALGCKPVQVCLCATRTHIQGLRLFC